MDTNRPEFSPELQSHFNEIKLAGQPAVIEFRRNFKAPGLKKLAKQAREISAGFAASFNGSEHARHKTKELFNDPASMRIIRDELLRFAVELEDALEETATAFDKVYRDRKLGRFDRQLAAMTCPPYAALLETLNAHVRPLASAFVADCSNSSSGVSVFDPLAAYWVVFGCGVESIDVS